MHAHIGNMFISHCEQVYTNLTHEAFLLQYTFGCYVRVIAG